MDILIDKDLTKKQLKKFLDIEFPKDRIFIFYKDENSWDQVENHNLIIEYIENRDLKSGFKYSLSIFIKHEEILKLIERLSYQLSIFFNCRVFCDGSRVVLKKQNIYYSLLFENGEIFLVDDSLYEETGEVIKIIKLNYSVPNYF